MSAILNRVAKAIMAAENPDSADQYAEMARAAIEEIREPTEDMRHMGFCCGRDASPIEIWRSMVDVALEKTR